MHALHSVFKPVVSRSAFALLTVLLAACGQGGPPDSTASSEGLERHAIDGQYTVEATGSNVTRVVWSVDGQEVHTSEEAPFELVLDLADYDPGEHRIDASITIDVLQERSDVHRTVTFTVGGDGSGITWTLVDARTDEDVTSFENDDTLTMDDPAHASARLGGVDGPVTFYLDGSRTKRENNPPYALFGDSNGDYHAGDLSGTHTIRALAGDGSEHVVTVTVGTDDGSGDDGTGDDGSGDAPTGPAGEAEPRLLSAWGWPKNDTLQIDEFAYRPSYVQSGTFAGFDRLFTRSVDSRDFRFFLELTRDATVVLAWPADAAEVDWTPEWEAGPTVELDDGTYDTFVNVLPAGEHELPEFGMLGARPTFLIGEADGSPSGYPTAPDGREQPQPNERCPEWVHEQYTAEHDGTTYRTWHPPIDPVYACNFEHEHGSDPDAFAGDVQPLFDRYAGMPTPDGGTLGHEGHAGFKVLVTEPRDGAQLMATIHGNSAGQRRVCTRYHATDMVIADADDGTVRANLAFKGDFGFPRIFEGGPRLDPSDCPEAIDISDTDGRRTFLAPHQAGGYEPWLHGLSTAAALPFEGNVTWTLANPQTLCNDEEHCDDVIPTGEDDATGTRRWFDLHGLELDARSGDWDTFCTDVYGWGRLDCSDAGAVEQYVEDGFHWSPPSGRFSVAEPFTATYVTLDDAPNFVYEIETNINGNVPIGGSN